MFTGRGNMYPYDSSFNNINSSLKLQIIWNFREDPLRERERERDAWMNTSRRLGGIEEPSRTNEMGHQFAWVLGSATLGEN